MTAIDAARQDEEISVLRQLLAKTVSSKKHAAYQRLPQRLADILGPLAVELRPKFEHERWAYIRDNVPLRGRSVLDIGCNTGYFMFAALDDGARCVTGYEGGVFHADFARRTIGVLGEGARAEIKAEYFDFQSSGERVDVAFLLNVLHHVGDDYGDPSLDISAAKQAIAKSLREMHKVAERLVFQLGFNWKGDISRCLFDHGLKSEMIEFVREAVRGVWTVTAIGVATRGEDGEVRYSDVSPDNIARMDALGEFLNRPIFILERIEAAGFDGSVAVGPASGR
ncbi:DUF1698 domain-containing protein [Xylophilus sp. GW821-FHT01B05]